MFSDDQLLRGEFDSAAYLRYILHVTSGVDTGAEQKRLDALIRQIDDNIKHTLSGTEQRKRVTACLVNEVRAIHECGSVISELSSNMSSLQRTSQRLESFVVEPYNRIRQTINQIENAQHALKVIKVVNRYITCARQVERLVGTLDQIKLAANSVKSISENENSIVYKHSSTASNSAPSLQTALRVARLLHEMKRITMYEKNNNNIINNSKISNVDITEIKAIQSLANLHNTAMARISQIAQQTLSMLALLECNKEKESLEEEPHKTVEEFNATQESRPALLASETEATTTKSKIAKCFTNLSASDNIVMVSMTLNDVALALQSLYYIGLLPSIFSTALQNHVHRAEQYINEELSLERFLHLVELSHDEHQYNEGHNNSTTNIISNRENKKINLVERAIAKILRYVQQQTQIVMLLWQGLLESNHLLLDNVEGVSIATRKNVKLLNLFNGSANSKLHNAQDSDNSIDYNYYFTKVKQLLESYWQSVFVLLVQKLQTIITNEHINRELAANYPRLREMFANFFFLLSSSPKSSSSALSPNKYCPMSLPNGQAITDTDYYHYSSSSSSSASFLLSQNSVALSALTLQHCTVSNYALLMSHILQLSETAYNMNNNTNNKQEQEEYVKQINVFYTSIVNPVEQHYAAVNLSRHRQQVNKVLARLAMLTPASSLLAQQMVHITSLHRLATIYDKGISNNNNNNENNVISQLSNLSTPTEATSLNASQYTKTFVHETYYVRHDLHTLSLTTENVVICLSQLSSKLFEVYRYCTSKLVISNNNTTNSTLETIITSYSSFVSLIEKTSPESVDSISRINLLFFNLVNACVQVINDIDHVIHILPSDTNMIDPDCCDNKSSNNNRSEMKEWSMLTKSKIEEHDHALLLERRSQLDQLRSSFVKLSKTQILEPLFLFAQDYFINLIKNHCSINSILTHRIANRVGGGDNVNTENFESNTISLEHALFTFVARFGVYITPLCIDWTDYMRVLTEALFEEFIQSLLAVTLHSDMHSYLGKENINKDEINKVDVLNKYADWLHNMKAIANTLNNFAHVAQPAGLHRNLIVLNGLSRNITSIFEIIVNGKHVQRMEEASYEKEKNDNISTSIPMKQGNNITDNNRSESIDANKNMESKETEDTTGVAFTSVEPISHTKTTEQQKLHLEVALQYLYDMKLIVQLILLFSLQFYMSTAHNQQQEHESVDYNHLSSANKSTNDDTNDANTIHTLSVCATKITQCCKSLHENKLRPLITQELYTFCSPYNYNANTCKENKTNVTDNNTSEINNETLRKEYITTINKTLQEIFTLLISNSDVNDIKQSTTNNASQSNSQILSQLYKSWLALNNK